MRTSKLTTIAAVAGCATLLLVGGCSGDATGDGKDKDKDGGSSSNKVGPLSAYFENMYGEEQDYEEMGRKSEEIVAACMLEQGFQYTPQDMSGMSDMAEATDGESEEETWGTEAFAAKNGYGMTTGMAPEPAAEGEEGADEWVDANADYVAGMSESEQAAYYAALYGDQMMAEPVEGEEPPPYDWTKAGCQGKAQHEIYEEGDPWSDPEFADLQASMNDVWEQAQQDPKMAELDAEWADCMAEEGYAEFAKGQDAIDSIMNEQNSLYEQGGEAGPDEAAMKKLREKEIATAVADARCKKATGYDEAVQKIQFAIEQEFVDTHKAELDAWVAKYAKK